MVFSSDVRLHRGTEPRFPDRCVVCSRAAPDGVFAVRGSRLFSWAMLLSPLLELLMPARMERVESPACVECVPVARWQRRMREIAAWLCVAIAFTIAIAIGVDSKWEFIGLAVLALVPPIAWDVLSPRVFDITVYTETMDYEFRSAEYAREFADLNEAEVS